MRIKCLKRLFGTCTTLSLVAGLFACGGGGGDATGTFTSNPNSGSGNPANPSPPATTTPIADGKLHAACSNCGALDDSTYAGSGVGIWQALNPGAQTRAVDVAIKGAAGRDLTLVFTNERVDEATHASFFGASIVTLPRDVAFAAALSASIPASHAENPDIQSVREFNSNGWKALIKAQQAAGAAHKAQLTHPVQRSAARDDIGAARDFWLLDKSRRHTTLQASATTSDGTQVNIWVENPEYGTGKVTPDIVSTLLRNYAGAGGVYDMVTRVGGALWGAVPTPGMIPAQQPIDLVVANFDNDGRPYGTIGYFWALNNFANQGSGETYYSNANLSLYLDSETLYLAGAAGAKRMQPVLAHESTHMLDFYRRDMLMGPQYSFDTWLAETAATMMADWVSFNLDPTYNSVRDDRFRIYLTYNNQGSYTCGLMTWEPGGAACDSYMTNGSFGGFLNRQFGLDFF
ncbi:MAG TPA: hemagglutinin, partial [Paraburkholderia sp.]|nr:hemagglutinin [Paraburkholderia sp.]